MKDNCDYIDCDRKPYHFRADYFRGFFVAINLCSEHNKLFDKIQAEDPDEKTRTIYYHRGIRIN